MSPTAPVSAARYPARWRRTTALLLILAAGPLEAQLQLPTVPVPLPPGHVIDAATQALSGTSERLLDAITGARSAAARALIRKQRAYIEADPDGAPIVRAELLAFDPGAAALSNATAMGFEILRRETLAGLAGELVTLRAPPRMSTRVALAQLRRIDPAGDYDYNHIYLPSPAGDRPAPRDDRFGPRSDPSGTGAEPRPPKRLQRAGRSGRPWHGRGFADGRQRREFSRRASWRAADRDRRVLHRRDGRIDRSGRAGLRLAGERRRERHQCQPRWAAQCHAGPRGRRGAGPRRAHRRRRW